MRYALRTIFVLLIGSFMAPVSPGQEPKATPGSPAQTKSRPRSATATASAKIKVVDATPEDAFRTFMMAIMTHDEAALRVISLPNPNPDFAWLLKGPVAPPEVAKDASARFAKLSIKRLKAGDIFTPPTGKAQTVTAVEVGEDKAVLVLEGTPIPIRCKNVEGHWKVETALLIAGDKAADAARKTAAAKKAAAPKPVPKN
jgi:hypothetical protein